MRVTGVIVRFLSLLDVTICLLGVLMLGLAATQFRMGNRPVMVTNVAMEELPTQFVLLYGGTFDEREGRVFTLEFDRRTKTWKLGPEVQSAMEIDKIADQLSVPKRDVQVMLLLSNRGFDRAWTREKIEELRKKWGFPIVVVPNVRFPFE